MYSRYSSFDETDYLFPSRRSALNITYVYRFLSFTKSTKHMIVKGKLEITFTTGSIYFFP